MAQAQTETFSKLFIEVGDGDDPEVFEKVCALENKSFAIRNNTQTNAIPDCTDEDAPPFEEETISSQSMPVSGDGYVTRQQHHMMLDWAHDGTTKNIRVNIGTPVTGQTDYFAGPAFLKNYEVTGATQGKLKAAIEFGWAAKPTKHLKAA